MKQLILVLFASMLVYCQGFSKGTANALTVGKCKVRPTHKQDRAPNHCPRGNTFDLTILSVGLAVVGLLSQALQQPPVLVSQGNWLRLPGAVRPNRTKHFEHSASLGDLIDLLQLGSVQLQAEQLGAALHSISNLVALGIYINVVLLVRLWGSQPDSDPESMHDRVVLSSSAVHGDWDSQDQPEVGSTASMNGRSNSTDTSSWPSAPSKCKRPPPSSPSSPPTLTSPMARAYTWWPAPPAVPM
jgi:hypothetical protein